MGRQANARRQAGVFSFPKKAPRIFCAAFFRREFLRASGSVIFRF